MPAHNPRARGVNGTIRLGLVLAAAVMVPHPALAAGPAPVDLGSAAHFAILGDSSVSSTGGGTIEGDLGLSPGSGSSITGILTNQVHGVVYQVDATGPLGPYATVGPGLLSTSRVDSTAAYLDAEGRTVDRIVLSANENLGGQTLAPGLFWSPSALQIAGDLILDAGGDPNAVWIFQMHNSTLTTAEGAGHSRVILAGGAQARNVFWQVGSSATIKTFSVFKGTILALSDITMDTSCVIEGRALAGRDITFNGTSISLPTPEAPRFTHISRTATDSATVVLSTPPYFLVTLEACPDLLLTNWTTIVTDTPAASPWTNTDYAATAAVTQRFYRAFITP